MSEKVLTEADWTSFAKDEGLGDSKTASKDSKALHETVRDALQALGSVEKSNAAEDKLLAALDALEGVLTKQVAANAKRKDKDGKAIKDTKAVKDQLYKMLSAVDKQRKEVQAAKDKKDKEAAAKGGDDDDDDESPAILNTKMVPLIRQLKKGDVRYPALIGSIGKSAAVLISRKSITNAKRKVLTDALGVKAGVKFAKGDCYYENNTLHFVMEGKIAGLAKWVRAALLAQTKFRLKVKLRGEDGAEEDGVEENAPSAERLEFAKRLVKLKAEVDKAVVRGDARAGELQALLDKARKNIQEDHLDEVDGALTSLERLLEAEAAAKVAAKTAGDTAEQEAATEGDVDPKLAFSARLKAMTPRIQQAIAGPPPNAEVKLKLSSMTVHAKKGDYGDAQAVLDEIEALLARAGKGNGKDTKAPETSATADDAEAGKVDALRAQLQDDFDALQRGPLSPEQREQFGPIMNAWNAAQDATDDGLHGRALLILQRLADVGSLARLRQALAAGGAGGADKGRIVRQRTFMLQRWAKIPPALRGQLDGLRKVLEDSGADDDPGGLVDEIQSELEDLLEELQDLLDDAINKGSTAGLRGVRARFESDSLVQHLRSGPVDADKLLRAVLGAVDEIEAEMTRG